ncbi:hypothetical protein LCGC14_0341300 [marine sediment metagenome]|uniref:Uncharacterized protein n=1 Tax=marine sediment metagenome TaxID=412755 RepID=A0A0F9WLB7_9ZZZZ
MKRIKIISHVFIIIAAILVSLSSCYEGDPFPDGWFERIFVGSPTTTSVADNLYGGIIASGSIRSEAAVTAVTYDEGTGLWVSEYGTVEPEHTAVGSFDLTGGAYENLFTSTTPIFTAADADSKNFIVIVNEGNYGQAAEISIFIDVSNVVLKTTGWTADFADASFEVFVHPLFFVGEGGRIAMHARDGGNVGIESSDYTHGALFTVALESGADAVEGILVDVEANGYSGIEGIEIEYATGALQPTDHVSIFKVDMDETGAVASDATTEVDFINLTTTDEYGLEKHAIHIGESFDSALTVAGGAQVDPDFGYEVTPDVPVDRVTGIAPDGTAFLEASASDLIIFDDDNDYILIGSVVKFEHLAAILVSGSNQPIVPEWYYSTGGGNWAALVVSETTNGFTQSGIITFNAPGAWAQNALTQPAGAVINNAFYLKIVRTRNNLGSPPVEDYFKIFTSTSLTDFEIRGDGTIRPVEMTDASAPNNSLYFSTTQNKLAYKDNGGAVHVLW